MPSDPATRIAAGLRAVHEAIADLRAEQEKGAREQEARRGLLAQAEGKARALAFRAGDARRPRHLRIEETAGGGRMPYSDADPVVPTPIDERTQRSLDLYGLTPRAKKAPS